MSDLNGQLEISTDGSADDLVQLFNWLRHEDALRGRIRLQAPPISADRMGNLYDVLMVAVSAGGVGPVLARSLPAWLASRRSDITITIKHTNGSSVSVNGKRLRSDLPEQIQKIIEGTGTRP